MDSRLGTYLLVNGSLSIPDHRNVLEFKRVLLTRYRTGSHNLRIETGRMQPRVDRENRFCKCETGIQTLTHCFLDCPLLQSLRDRCYVANIEDGISSVKSILEIVH